MDNLFIIFHFLCSYSRNCRTLLARDVHQTTMDLNLANSKGSLPSIKVTMADVAKLLRVNDIVKSQQDNREYRGLQLTNGLKVLLISDPATDKAAAAMTVDVGHMSDPDNLPGLAHFCEHMLFLGTKKYPNENAYSTYLSENGGTSNASTYADNTVSICTSKIFHVFLGIQTVKLEMLDTPYLAYFIPFYSNGKTRSLKNFFIRIHRDMFFVRIHRNIILMWFTIVWKAPWIVLPNFSLLLYSRIVLLIARSTL